MICEGRKRRVRGRAKSFPVLIRRRGLPAYSCSFLPKGACGTLGRKCRARGARWLGEQPACRLRRERHPSEAQLKRVRSSELNRPQKQTFTCVPHADGFIGLLDVPGFAASAHAPRSCVLTPGHSLVPSARVASVCHIRPSGQPALATSAARRHLRTSAPRSTPRRRPQRAFVSVRDGGDDSSPSADVKNKIGTFETIFSGNQKADRSFRGTSPTIRWSSPRTRRPIRRVAHKSAGARCLSIFGGYGSPRSRGRQRRVSQQPYRAAASSVG